MGWYGVCHVCLHCDKTPEADKLKEPRFILADSFRGFTPQSASSIDFISVARQKHRGGGDVAEGATLVAVEGS